MSAPSRQSIRCAIYTRKSTEEGLDQAFNSLHAQRESCEAYVRSQAGEGWRALPAQYDDGGFSGGTMERPALRRLMDDVDAGRIDTVVVYKVDRLTRSLADFAKIVERLDAAGSSFVSVTQAFNTTTSMGRLTLNVLLSFAQFEREVTGERIRDKIAASKAKGMWMGGPLPLGYDPPIDPRTRALVVNSAEAEQVRMIFETYLSLGSVSALEAHLAAESIRSKAWTSRQGRTVGGARLSRGALFHLLKSRLYLGEIPHRDMHYPGSHPPIIDVALFDAVQVRLAHQRKVRRERPTRVAGMPLRGLLFDADGDPMCPSFGYGRAGRVYRYYVSAPLQQGRKPKTNPDAIRRVVRDELVDRLGAAEDASLVSVLGPVRRIEVEAQALRLILQRSKVARAVLGAFAPHETDDGLVVLNLPIRCRLRGGRTWITPPPGFKARIRPRRDATLIRGLRDAHRIAASIGWSSTDGSIHSQSEKAPASQYQRKICRLAFLDPDLQRAILTGTQPQGLTLDQLVHGEVPLAWPDQRRAFNFPEK
jgi:site-specific DNA recombinase